MRENCQGRGGWKKRREKIDMAKKGLGEEREKIKSKRKEE